MATKKMKTIKYSPEEYQKLILETINRKLNGLIVGIVVLVILIGTVLYGKSQLEQDMQDISFQAPPPAPINIDKVIDKNSVVDLQSQIMPSTVPPVTITQEQSGLKTGETSSIMSGKVTNTGKTYTVQEGDSLASIAEKFYGDGNAWVVIAQANHLDSPDQIDAGMVLKIPRK